MATPKRAFLIGMKMFSIKGKCPQAVHLKGGSCHPSCKATKDCDRWKLP